ncbi:hypothetical protein L915_11626 [Phytophthora nicotianae]|uniref:Ubiquitin-like protease family profile domain-containing protein n=1 Tax=Phytophthora nicotianae TaxID=4792 RepID=W2GLI0_PHYNI|nr:hypothetical protein L915_11626 [Phytophthora nicotianae]
MISILLLIICTDTNTPFLHDAVLVCGRLSRWTCSSRPLKKVKQFSYEKFTEAGRGSTQKKLGTHSERYREAVRATHLIANEMADIEDEVEFEEMLRFVLDQWRNVRQRKSVPRRKSEDGDESQGDEQCGHGEKEDADKQIPVRTFTEDEIKAEFNISSSEDEEASQSGFQSNMYGRVSPSQGGTVKIRLNPKVKKVGCPQKHKKSTSAGEKKGRKWYEASEAGRTVAGEVTLTALVNSLDREQPGLMETQRRLSGVLMKHGEAENKKPKFKILKNPVLIQDPFYTLPEKLLDACMKLLPVSNTANHAISIDESQHSQGTGSAQLQGSVETIWIKHVGNFLRAQIETFKRVHNLMEVVKLGLDTHKWLVQEGIFSLPAEYHAVATSVADEILSTYPKKRIEGLPNLSDFQYALLYRVSPPTWLSDASIRALCIRLCEDYSSCRFAGFHSAVARPNRTRTEEPVVDHATRERVIKMAREDDVDTVLLPLNFSNFCWCCVVVKVHAKRIYYYDPLNQGPYIKAANAVANSLKIGGLTKYDVIPQNNPIQFDGFSCGVYVCWMFIRQVSTGHPVNISVASLTKRRFELFYYMLKGHLLPIQASVSAEQDGTEEKRPAVAQHEDQQQTHEEEQVEPTRKQEVAQTRV